MRVPTRFRWSLVSDERLLDTRICDLPIKIKGSFIEPHIKRLYSELNDRGIRYKPHVWLSEWFNGGWRSCEVLIQLRYRSDVYCAVPRTGLA